ncbi:hypothetical protein D9M71_773730 [compost metagenome]
MTGHVVNRPGNGIRRGVFSSQQESQHVADNFPVAKGNSVVLVLIGDQCLNHVNGALATLGISSNPGPRVNNHVIDRLVNLLQRRVKLVVR